MERLIKIKNTITDEKESELKKRGKQTLWKEGWKMEKKLGEHWERVMEEKGDARKKGRTGEKMKDRKRENLCQRRE